MKLQSKPASALAFVLTAVVGLGALSGAAIAAGSSVSLEVKGEYAKLHRTACGKTKNFRAFHRGSTLEFRGFLTPPPAGHFPVRIKLERCVRGHFRAVVDLEISGKKLTGKFKGFSSARPLAPRPARRRVLTYYRARAFAGGAESPEAYFAVGS